jgi:hypothetical protein
MPPLQQEKRRGIAMLPKTNYAKQKENIAD